VRHTPRPALRESAFNVWAHEGVRSQVYNGASGRHVSMSAGEHNAVLTWLNQGQVANGHERLLERLVRARALVPIDADEVENLQHRYQRSRHDPTHLGLTVVTSLGCNFDCPYCFESKSPALLEERVGVALRKLLVDRLDDLSTFAVTWYGGEPLLARDALLRLATEFRDTCATSRSLSPTAGISTTALHASWSTPG